ncbi:MAG: hypothetical protein QOJ91_3083 [Sphingomonadales bacterium]|jgi:hypothetical protein|nr:hypothetical protein [Sphingomonadales bacterium]
MSDFERRLAEDQARMSTSIVDLTSSFSLASQMLTIAGTFCREQVSATEMQQLNAISAMLQLVREYGDRGRPDRAVVTEALDLAKQVVAAAQTP